MKYDTTKSSPGGSLLAIVDLVMLFVVPNLALAQTTQQVNVTLKEFMITPSKITVLQGQAVQFTVTNASTVEHSFTLELHDRGIEHKLFNNHLLPGEMRTAA